MGEDNSSRHITDEWLHSIYHSVEKIGLCQRRMRDGCIDLQEFIINYSQQNNISLIQYQNAKIMITEIDLLLSNIEPIIPKTEYASMKEYIKTLDKLSENKFAKHKIYNESISEDRRKQNFELTNEFTELIRELSILRARIISNLGNILFLEGNLRKDTNNKPLGVKPDE